MTEFRCQIRSTYNGPSGLRGARIVVRLLDGPLAPARRTMPYDFSAVRPHQAAVEAFLLEVVGITGEEARLEKLPARRSVGSVQHWAVIL